MKALALDSRGLAVIWSVWLMAASIIPANQTGTVRGVVRAKGQPVPYANVIVIGTRLGAVADSAGKFTLRGVPSGLRLIQVQATFYELHAENVQVVEGDNPPIVVALTTSHVRNTFSASPERFRPACDPYFTVEPYQGDRAVPRGAVVLDYSGEVPRARTTDSARMLQIESIYDPCVLDIWYKIAGADGPPSIAVLDSVNDTVRVFDGGARAQLRWDGTDSRGTRCGPGSYRVILVAGGASYQLRCRLRSRR